MDQEKLLTYCKEESEDHIKQFACKCIKHAVAELPYSFARDPKWEGRNRIGANAHCYDGGIIFYQTRPKQFFFESEKCCKIAEVQITQREVQNEFAPNHKSLSTAKENSQQAATLYQNQRAAKPSRTLSQINLAETFYI